MGDRSKAAQHRCGQLGALCAICGIDKPALRGMSASDLPWAPVESVSFAGRSVSAGNEVGKELVERQALRARQDRLNGVGISDKANRIQRGPMKIDLQYCQQKREHDRCVEERGRSPSGRVIIVWRNQSAKQAP